jgi:hypothetical protein
MGLSTFFGKVLKSDGVDDGDGEEENSIKQCSGV